MITEGSSSQWPVIGGLCPSRAFFLSVAPIIVNLLSSSALAYQCLLAWIADASLLLHFSDLVLRAWSAFVSGGRHRRRRPADLLPAARRASLRRVSADQGRAGYGHASEHGYRYDAGVFCPFDLPALSRPRPLHAYAGSCAGGGAGWLSRWVRVCSFSRA